MNKEPNETRVRGLFAMRKLSPELKREVLTEDVLRRFDLPITRAVQLSDGISLDLGLFNEAVAKAARGEAVAFPIKRDDADECADLTVEADGSVVLQTPSHRWRIGHAALLPMEVGRRIDVVAQILAAHTLRTATKLKIAKTIRDEALSNDELVDALAQLNGSAESFLQRLVARLREGQLGVTDLLPVEHTYWENITAGLGDSTSLPSFIQKELAEERAAQVKEDVRRGFQWMAHTFAAPELVPLAWADEQTTEVLMRGLSGILNDLDDPFALVGAFEICAETMNRDERLVSLGEQILDKLFSDLDRLMFRSRLFGAIFVLASAQLAVHAKTRQKPAFWRRLAAAAHAGWVTQVISTSGLNDLEFLRWAMRERGQEYLLSAARDMSELPRWQPEWIDAEFLVPDTCGRAYFALARLGEQAPKAWSDRIETIKGWIKDHQWEARMHLPSVLQGARLDDKPQLNAELAGQMQAALEEFARAPSVDGLLALAPWIEVLGQGAEAISGAKLLLQQRGIADDGVQNGERSAALAISMRLALINNDSELAQAVADRYVERFRSKHQTDSISQLVSRLVECAAAETDATKRTDLLAKRLTALALFLPPGEPCAVLRALLETLQHVDYELAPRIAQAVHATRAGIDSQASP
jgi:hypothetical protein